MFECMECGKKFRTVGAAERALNNGCPGCGGSDIDTARIKPRVSPKVDVTPDTRTMYERIMESRRGQ